MSESEPGKSESSESSCGPRRWCFVLDMSGRIVHTEQTATAAEAPGFGVDLDSPDGCPAPRSPAASLTRPSWDTPWWVVTVEAPDKWEAGRTALALVEDDRAAYGLGEAELDPDPGATPLPPAGDVALVDDLPRDFSPVFEAVESSCCKARPEPSRTSLVITDVPERTRELVRRSEEFARVRTYRGYLDHATHIAAPTEDVRILVEQAEFWHGEFAATYNGLHEQLAALARELDEARDEIDALLNPDREEAPERPDEGGALAPAPLAPVTKECFDVPCPELETVTFELQETTWEFTFDLAGHYGGLKWGDSAVTPLEPGEAPRIVPPDFEQGQYWFVVHVRATNSTTATELAWAVLKAEYGVTGDALGVMEGTTSVEEAETTPQHLGYLKRWATNQVEAVEDDLARVRGYVERLEQAGAVT